VAHACLLVSRLPHAHFLHTKRCGPPTLFPRLGLSETARAERKRFKVFVDDFFGSSSSLILFSQNVDLRYSTLCTVIRWTLLLCLLHVLYLLHHYRTLRPSSKYWPMFDVFKRSRGLNTVQDIDIAVSKDSRKRLDTVLLRDHPISYTSRRPPHTTFYSNN